MNRKDPFRYRLTGRNISDISVRVVLFICAAISVLAVFFILAFLLIRGWPAIHHEGIWKFLNPNGEWKPDLGLFGAFPLIVATLLVSLGAMVIAVPLGIGSAIFISELVPSKVKLVLKFIVELLSGIPSVVYGFFGLIVLTDWLRVTFDQPSGKSWLAGSILLGIMALPTIISVSEDAISAVPKEYKEASLGTGATKWQTIWRVVIPCALSGITAAIILGLGRAIGETMAVMMVTGNTAMIPHPLTNVFATVKTLTGAIAVEMGETSATSIWNSSLFVLAIILFAIVLITNTIANYTLKRLNEKFSAKCNDGVKKRFQIPKRIKGPLTTVGKKAGLILCLVLIIGICASWLGWVLGTILALIISEVLVILYLLSFKISARITQKIAFTTLGTSMLIVLLLVGIIIYYIVSNGLPALSWTFISKPPRDVGRAGGIYPAIIGTLLLVAGSMLFAMPLGICAGIYLSEYAGSGRITRIIRLGIDNLNGTPSIVFGLFGMAFFVLTLGMGVCMLAGQLTLALMVLPTVIRTTEEAIKSVPQTLREGSLACGATKWQTIRKVVLPPAMPGIITGIILSIGRAAGETAPILFTAVVFSQRFIPDSPFKPVMALPYHLFVLSTSVPNSQTNSAGTALVLLILIIIIYSIAGLIRLKYKKSMKW